MEFWPKIKQFFGLSRHVVPPPPPRPAEEVQQALARMQPAQVEAYIRTRLAEAETAWAGLAASDPRVRDEQLELLFFLYTQLHPEIHSQLVPEYETLLGRVAPVYQAYARDGETVLRLLDQYIQRYEEDIYLTEATGEYMVRQSEHARFIRFPFMSGKVTKSAQRQAAQKVLDELFVSVRSLPYLALTETVPWTPISFIDFMALARQKQISLLRDGTGYYGYVPETQVAPPKDLKMLSQ